MLKKLLKYEFKSTAKTMIPLLLGTLALSILTTIIISFNIRSVDSSVEDSLTSGTLITLFTTFSIFSIIAIFAAAVALVILLFARYYKSFFADEGYLTFTLPAKMSTHLTTKFICGFTWMTLGSVTLFLSACIILFFGTASSGQIINIDLYNEISTGFSEFKNMVGTANFVFYIIEIVLAILVSSAYKLLMIYLAITLGGIIAKKHKILAAVGFYIIISIVVSSLTSTITSALFINSFSGINQTSDILDVLIDIPHTLFVYSIIISVVFAVAAYITNYYLLKKKLNLE